MLMPKTNRSIMGIIASPPPDVDVSVVDGAAVGATAGSAGAVTGTETTAAMGVGAAAASVGADDSV
ncbi:MAG: hypothetical protein OXC99_03370 [Chloroflexi bacterium]|nr:hypothetical protein [Chloroflexota bacterium]